MTDAGDADPVESGYDALYAAWGRSPTFRRIWQEHVTGADLPEEFAHISFLRLTDLQTLGDALRLEQGGLLVDLACGAGGPGLWVANERGARLVGVDLSAVAIERANERAGAPGLGDRASFTQGTFETTGLSSAGADAVMTVDALQYVPGRLRRRGGSASGALSRAR